MCMKELKIYFRFWNKNLNYLIFNLIKNKSRLMKLFLSTWKNIFVLE